MPMLKKMLVVLGVILLIAAGGAYAYTQSKKATEVSKELSIAVRGTTSTLLGQDELIARLVDIGADKETLRYVATTTSNYVRDADSVYWVFVNPRKIMGADPETFTVLDGSGYAFARDNKHLYITGDMVDDADPNSFTALDGGGYFRDARSVFYQEMVNTHTDYRYKLEKIAGADSHTIRTFSRLTTNVIAVDSTHVYLRGEPVAGADGNTFSLVASPYFTDANATYFFGGDPEEHLQLIAPTSSVRIFTNDALSGGYVRIGDHIYHGTTTLDGMDAATFHVFDAEVQNGDQVRGPCESAINCPYVADANAVYYDTKIVVGADPRTFELLGYGLLKGQGKDPDERQPAFARDGAHVYYKGEVVLGADAKTFTPIVSGGYYYEYGKDAQGVYWQTKHIGGADPKTFHALEGQQAYEGCSAGRYGVDATAVYYQDKKIDGADPKTFTIVVGDSDYGVDASHFFEGASTSDKKNFKECTYG